MPKTTKTEWFIYALTDPRTGERRYVGKSVDPLHRISVHLHAARHGEHTYRSRWIKGLLDNGLKPGIEILESGINKDDVDDRERFWISHGRGSGWKLTNMTEGGDGGLEPGSDGAKKVSASLKGRPKPPRTAEHIAHLAAACSGRKLSQDAIAKRSETVRRKHSEGYRRPPVREDTKAAIGSANRGRKHSEEEKERRAAAARGKKHPDEWCKNISEGLKKRHYVHPPEIIERIAASRRGKPMSQEAKDKISASLKKHHQDKKNSNKS